MSDRPVARVAPQVKRLVTEIEVLRAEIALLPEQVAETVCKALAARVTAALDSRPLLTYAQVAERLQVSERTVWSLVDSGRLPAVKIGKTEKLVRVAPSAIERFLAEQAMSTK